MITNSHDHNTEIPIPAASTPVSVLNLPSFPAEVSVSPICPHTPAATSTPAASALNPP